MLKLLTFLARWNISLWHYRASGSDLARVLVGVQVPPLGSDVHEFEEFIATYGDGINRFVSEETENELYKNFLV